MKKISIITPCYNEEGNVEELYKQVKAQFDKLKDRYTYEHVFIDNASKDRTVEILKGIAAKDKNVKIIVNAANYGHIRSPFHGMKQCYGDAVMLMVADLQDPPELIPEFLEKWEEGHHVVVGVKNKSKENPIMYGIRKLFYTLVRRMSETPMIDNFTGFGLYDKAFMDVLRATDDPYPYLRGFVAEFGGDIATVYYTQPAGVAAICLALGYDGVPFISLFAIFCVPTAVSSYPMAEQMGGDGPFSAEVVATTSLFSLVTVFVWVACLQAAGMI